MLAQHKVIILLHNFLLNLPGCKEFQLVYVTASVFSPSTVPQEYIPDWLISCKPVQKYFSSTLVCFLIRLFINSCSNLKINRLIWVNIWKISETTETIWKPDILLHELVQVFVQAVPYSMWGQQAVNTHTSKKVVPCRFTIVTPWKTRFASSLQKQF